MQLEIHLVLPITAILATMPNTSVAKNAKHTSTKDLPHSEIITVQSIFSQILRVPTLHLAYGIE